MDDLLSIDDKSFCQRVIKQVFERDGSFRTGQNDHRYRGVENAWIRYISRGSTAYRLIYLRRGNEIYLYRAGTHSIENRVSPPVDFSGVAEVDAVTQVVEGRSFSKESSDLGNILVSRKRFDEQLICDYFERMYHLGHVEIFLISPFVDFDLLQRHKPLGRFLDRQIEEGAVVSLLTEYVENLEDFKICEELGDRDVNMLFLRKLHAKLYLFEIDTKKISRYFDDQIPKVAILGSSNLTERGLGFSRDDTANWELCYRPEFYRYDELRTHAHQLSMMAKSLPEMRRNIGL